MQGQIQVVFFDAAGTLFHVNGSVAEIYLKHAQSHGFPAGEDSLRSIKRAFARAFQEAPPPVFAATEPIAIKQCERLWWFDIVHSVFYRVGMFERFDEFFEEVFEVFADPRSWALYPDTLPVLRRLKEEGFELGIVSNFDSRLFRVLKGLGLSDLFATVTISSLAHAAKPAPRIFEVALEKHAVDPDEAVHVGDSLTEDVEGARKAGLTGVYLDREGISIPPSVHTVTTLEEIPALLSRL